MTEEDYGFAVSDSETVVIESNFYNWNRARKSFVAWFQKDGKNIGMIRFLIGGQEYDVPMLCDIEVREEYRGQKLALHFIKILEEKIVNGTLYTSGHYTPEGYRSLGEFLPLPQYAIETGDKPQEMFRSMNFVHDWDQFQLIH